MMARGNRGRVGVVTVAGAALLMGVTLALLAVRRDEVDCSTYRPVPGFWQRSDAISAEVASRRARLDIACLPLRGRTLQEAEASLGPPLSMREWFGSSSGERFRVWQRATGVGIYVSLDPHDRITAVEEQREDVDRDIW